MLAKDVDALQPHVRAFVERAVTFSTCPECGGTRLNEAARSSKIAGISIADACAMQISDLATWVRGLSEPSVAPLLVALRDTLDSFTEIGLGYLSLDRSSGTLSGGESQRTKMVRHLGSALTDVTYVFDEPTIGLHPHDIQRMNALLLRLRDKGNTVLVVEHKPETIVIADHVVDLGPGAGTAGGEVCFEGTVDGLRASGTSTGRHLEDRARLKEAVRSPNGALEIRGASEHNLRDVDVDLPLGVLVVVTGVAGSGKSSLVHGSLRGREGAVVVDQAPIRGSRRSNPATYTGLLEPIRKAFAKANGVEPALFSANSEGACPNYNGAGVVYTDLAMMAGVATPCEVCEGRRFSADVARVPLRRARHQRGARDVPSPTPRPSSARARSRLAAAHTILRHLVDVGLGYVSLGQPLTTLSGGERQRLKLATHLGDKGGLVVLDEPTTGLHLADVDQLLALLDRLVDAGKSLVVIEHHQAVMAHADWIIDLGPGAGHDGGRVVFEGTPAELVARALHADGRAPGGVRRCLRPVRGALRTRAGSTSDPARAGGRGYGWRVVTVTSGVTSTAVRPGPAQPHGAAASRAPARSVGTAWSSGSRPPLVLVLGFIGLDRHSVWRDEAASLVAVDRSLPQLWTMLAHVESVHAVYYTFLHVWLQPGGGEVWARVPSVLAMAVTAGLLAVVGSTARLGAGRAGRGPALRGQPLGLLLRPGGAVDGARLRLRPAVDLAAAPPPSSGSSGGGSATRSCARSSSG